MLGILFENITQTLSQAKDLNKVLLEELRLCNCKLRENLPDITYVQEVEEIENKTPEISEDNVESIRGQDKEDFEINEQAQCGRSDITIHEKFQRKPINPSFLTSYVIILDQN